MWPTRVTFTGRRPRELLKLYYSAADAFVTTPWYEAFGMTTIEAMACGTPVVGARVGGIKYSVLDGNAPASSCRRTIRSRSRTG